MSPPMSDFRLKLTWRWSACAAPGQRALSGLQILLRYLGLRATTMSQGHTSCSLLLSPALPEGPSEQEARGHLRDWEPRILGSYPGSSWRVEAAERETSTAA